MSFVQIMRILESVQLAIEITAKAGWAAQPSRSRPAAQANEVRKLPMTDWSISEPIAANVMPPAGTNKSCSPW
jgi:hypothetical protein